MCRVKIAVSVPRPLRRWSSMCPLISLLFSLFSSEFCDRLCCVCLSVSFPLFDVVAVGSVAVLMTERQEKSVRRTAVMLCVKVTSLFPTCLYDDD